MKKIILCGLLFLLTGCASVNNVVDAYLMTKFDPNEYKLITTVRFNAQKFKLQCDNAVASKSNATKIADDSLLYVLYNQYIPRNKELNLASQNLLGMANGLSDQYNKGPVSPAFCKVKFQNIETLAEKIQSAVAGRPR